MRVTPQLVPLGVACCTCVFFFQPPPALSEPGEESLAQNVRLGHVGDRAIRLSFDGAEGRTYWVETSEDMVSWTPMSVSAARVASGRFEQFDPAGPAKLRIFYRVREREMPADQALPESVFKREGNLAEGTGSSSHSFTTAYPESLLVAPGESGVAPGGESSPPLGEAELNSVIAIGMESWRKPGAHGSCVSCHSPDAFDLALIGYSDADILRRSLDHVSPEDGQNIVALVKATRQRHGIERPLHPRRFRPLQPGHEVLPGATREARDLAFGHLLNEEVGLLWARNRITSVEMAREAERQLLAVDLRKLRVGIAFDHWSADAHHGAEHRVTSEWVPMMGLQPRAEYEAEWYALQDAYIADPSDSNFWAYYDKIDEFLEPVEPPGFPRGQAWSELKYKSAHIAQHMLRHQTLNYPDPLAGLPGSKVANRIKIIARNPLFRTGDHVRRFPLHYDAANPSTTFPPHLAATMPPTDAALRADNANFLAVWFWMGWAYDPPLLLSDTIFPTVEGDYLYSSLLAHYKLHHAFVVAKVSAEKANAAEFFSEPGPGVAGHGKWAAFNPFMVLHHIERNRNEPGTGDARRPMHDRMFSNTARMWIYLVHDDLVQSGSVFDRRLVRAVIPFCRAWLDQTEPGMDHSVLDAVIADIDARLDSAVELRTDFSGPDLPGGLGF